MLKRAAPTRTIIPSEERFNREKVVFVTLYELMMAYNHIHFLQVSLLYVFFLVVLS